jgi:hypothetical protein
MFFFCLANRLSSHSILDCFVKIANPVTPAKLVPD